MEKQFNSNLEIRVLENYKISALVNNFTPSKMLKNKKGQAFKEVCPKSAWEKAINDDIKVLINHQDYYNVGINKEIRVTDQGVFLDIELDPIKERGIYENVKNGQLKECSFGFNVISDKWLKDGDYYKRTLEDIKLIGISLLDSIGAYNNTTIECRSIDIPYDSLDIKKKQLQLYKLM